MTVSALDHILGGLEEVGKPFSPAYLTECDRRDGFPADACAVLDNFGLNHHYVPVQHGGRLASYEDLLALWRTVASRDLTVAIGHGKTFLGCVCVWVAGAPDQASQLGAETLGGAVVSWGLTERQHGADLLACELSAERTAGGWRVNGEKWLINNATRGQMISVLARTDPVGGPRGFSVFLIDKRRLPPNSYRFLPKERTHGIRGADISGIAFQDAIIPDAALIGEVGDGIAITLKALQISRTSCVAVSLGAADHSLRLAHEFAKQHQLYGHNLVELPMARRILGQAAATLLVSEAVTTLAIRSIHALPSEMSVVSAIDKAFVPTAVDEMIASLGELLGVRAYLTEAYADGAFQKLERDHRLIAIFDGSTVVNRNALINQFHTLARAYRKGCCNEDGLAEAATLNAALKNFEPRRLSLLSSNGCSAVQVLPDAVRQLREQVTAGIVPAAVGKMAETLQTITETVIEQMATYTPSSRDVPPAAFTIATRYELCFAGAACLQLWLRNAAWVSTQCEQPLWRNALWLEACLVYVLNRLNAGAKSGTEVDVNNRLVDVLTTEMRATTFSFLPGVGKGSAI